MKKRMLVMLVVAAAFLVTIGLVKFLQIRTAIAQYASFQPPPDAVTTVITAETRWPSGIEFESGRPVHVGDVLVRLDTSQEREQLAAAEAQRELAKLNLDRSVTLFEKNVISAAERDRFAAEAKQADAHAGEIRATIERKTIRAPFTGVLGLRRVNLGQYMNGGDPVVPLQSMDPVYVTFSLPQGDVGALRPGGTVRVSADSGLAGILEGRISAINSIVDKATRNVQVQATLRNPQARLRPGMFVEVQADLGRGAPVIALPASAIHYAPYGNSVFVVGNLKGPDGKPYRGVEQRFVKLGDWRGDQVAVVTGIKAGDEIVTSGVFKLRSGSAIVVDNKIKPANNPAAKPEDS